jgi:hypothetical protein
MKFVDGCQILSGQASGILPRIGHSLENRVFEPPARVVSCDFCLELTIFISRIVRRGTTLPQHTVDCSWNLRFDFKNGNEDTRISLAAGDKLREKPALTILAEAPYN